MENETAISNHKTIYLASAVTVFLLAVVISAIIIISHRSSTPISSSIVKQSSFSIFYPDPNTAGLSLDKSSEQYSKSSDGMSYEVDVDGKQVYISEQATPDVFSQSGVYDYKLSQAHEYSQFNTAAGNVALTRPSELQNQTIAWVNSKGTLMLARAIKPLTTAEWKQLFNNMLVIN